MLHAVSLVLLYEQKDTDGLAFTLKAFLMYVVTAERLSYQGTVYIFLPYFLYTEFFSILRKMISFSSAASPLEKNQFYIFCYSASCPGSRREAIASEMSYRELISSRARNRQFGLASLQVV